MFKSRDGFSLSYPAGWVRSPRNEYRLELLDSPNGGQEGVVVAGGHGAVTVDDEHPMGTTAAMVIPRYIQDVEAVLERRTLAIPAVAGGCQKLTKLTTKFTNGDPDYVRKHHIGYQVATDYFCDGPGGELVTINVLYWEDDKRQGQYRDIGLAMAKSIRFP